MKIQDDLTDGKAQTFPRLLEWVGRTFPAGPILVVDDGSESERDQTDAARKLQLTAWSLSEVIENSTTVSRHGVVNSGGQPDIPPDTFLVAVFGPSFGSPEDHRNHQRLLLINELSEVLIVSDELLHGDFASHLASMGYFSDWDPGSDLPPGGMVFRNLLLSNGTHGRGNEASFSGSKSHIEAQRDDAISRYEIASANHDLLAERFNTLADEHRALGEISHQLRLDMESLRGETEDRRHRE